MIPSLVGAKGPFKELVNIKLTYFPFSTPHAHEFIRKCRQSWRISLSRFQSLLDGLLADAGLRLLPVDEGEWCGATFTRRRLLTLECDRELPFQFKRTFNKP